jgi:hypothetical protein
MAYVKVLINMYMGAHNATIHAGRWAILVRRTRETAGHLFSLHDSTDCRQTGDLINAIRPAEPDR